MLDSLYTLAQALPWERSAHPGTVGMWVLLGSGFILSVVSIADLWKKKRPR